MSNRAARRAQNGAHPPDTIPLPGMGDSNEELNQLMGALTGQLDTPPDLIIGQQARRINTLQIALQTAIQSLQKAHETIKAYEDAGAELPVPGASQP